MTRPIATPRLMSLPPGAKTCVYAWGRGELGQLGLGPCEEVETPTRVPDVESSEIVYVTAGLYNTAMISAGGEVLMCGDNESGQLGGTGDGRSIGPRRVPALDSLRITHAAVGHGHTAVVTDQGAIATWGAGECGQLGQGSTGDDQPQPRVIRGTREVYFTRVACGAQHTVALTGSGHVFSFGHGAFGALGLGDDESQELPVLVERLWPVAVAQVACGDSHSVALDVGGQVWSWGRGKYGQLGLGDTRGRSTPERVAALVGSVQVAGVACGPDHTMAVSRNGELLTWGRGTWGQLGHGSAESQLLPKQVEALSEKHVVQAVGSAKMSLALTLSGKVYAMGGSAAAAKRDPAVRRIRGFPRGCRVIQGAAAGEHVLAICEAMPGTLGDGVRPAGSEPLRRSLPTRLIPSDITPSGPGPASCPPVTALLEAAHAAAQPLAPRRTLTDVIRAVEDVFSSPGLLVAGFSRPRSSEASPPGTPARTSPGSPARSSSDDEEAPAAAGAAASDDPPASDGLADIDPDLLPVPTNLDEVAGGALYPDWSHDLDSGAIESIYGALLRIYSPEVVAALGAATGRLMEGMKRSMVSASGAPEQEWLKALVVAMQNPLQSALLGRRDSSEGEDPGISTAIATTLLDGLAQVIARLTHASKRQLASWLATLPPETFASRIVRPMQKRMEGLIGRVSVIAAWPSVREDVLTACHVMDLLHESSHAQRHGRGDEDLGHRLSAQPDPWQEGGALVPEAEFYNRAITALQDDVLDHEYRAWMSLNLEDEAMDAPQPLVSLCQVPFLLLPETKARVLLLEALYQKQHEVRTSHIRALAQGAPPGGGQWLELRVRRGHVLEDALRCIAERTEDLKKPLRVRFISGGVEEEGLDEGGVAKEFFQLLVREVFEEEYGMFCWLPESRTLWFDPHTTEAPLAFQLVGVLVGLAIYNGHILDVRFPAVVYRRLLGESMTLEDLRTVLPGFATGLRKLLDMGPDVDVENTLCYTFAIDVEIGGRVLHVDLVPGGSDMPVTRANRALFVDLCIHHILERSVAPSFEGFNRGFGQVCGGPALSMFRPSELELLVCGLPHLDFEALERSTRYEGGYSADTPVVRWFWSKVAKMDMMRRRRLLAFITGCDRAPIGGLEALKLVVQRNGGDTMRLPTAHTCFNILLLPEYHSARKLEERLMLAIENAQGFGLA
ncbi:unnamed protein product [Pedinophyceae sp. YPF-701]|nr:unnamed protein product [Pedinophyceae sp. YPF-701]